MYLAKEQGIMEPLVLLHEFSFMILSENPYYMFQLKIRNAGPQT